MFVRQILKYFSFSQKCVRGLFIKTEVGKMQFAHNYFYQTSQDPKLPSGIFNFFLK